MQDARCKIKMQALFRAARGSAVVESTDARDLFELLCIGNGSLLLYSAELPTAPIVNININTNLGTDIPSAPWYQMLFSVNIFQYDRTPAFSF